MTSADREELARLRRALAWLEERGRVRTRRYGASRDVWTWDRRDGRPLVAAIEDTIAATGEG